MIEYFYAHTVAPAFVAVLIPGAVLVTLAVVAWPLALALAAVPGLCRRLAGVGTAAHRRSRLHRAQRTGRTRRACDRDDPGPRRTDGVRGNDAAARRIHGVCAALPGDAAGAAARPHATDRRTGGGDRPRRPGGRRGRRTAGAAWLDRADAAAAAGAGVDRRLPAGVRDRPGRPAACRYDCIHTPAARGAFRAGGDHRWPPVPAAPRGGSTVRFEHVRFTYPGRHASRAGGCRLRRAGRRDGGAGRAVGRRQDHHRQPAAAVLGSRAGHHQARRRRSARTDAGRSARPHRAGRAGHLPVQRYARGKCPSRQAGGDARGHRDRAAPGGAGGVRRRTCPTDCRRGWANAACSFPAVSASASPSRAPS